jgi:hypothetical protein
MYDAAFTLDDELDISRMIMKSSGEYIQRVGLEFDWDGSYTEKRGQVGTYGDSYYMLCPSNVAGVDPALCEFVSKGSFPYLVKQFSGGGSGTSRQALSSPV